MSTVPSRMAALMVTGAYWPELSGGGLQCRTMIRALTDRMDFRVLTTCTDSSLAADEVVDGTPVTRVYVDVSKPLTKIAAAARTIAFLVRHRASFHIVHLHGFSQKSVLIALMARLLGKRLVITIHTADHDEPQGVRRMGALAYWCYRRADRFIAISEALAANYRAAGLPESRLRVAPNGVDSGRFRPVTPAERAAARRAWPALPPDQPWIVFAGFFSRDKCPDVLFDAWLRTQETRPRSSALLFVGATDSPYHEVDASLARHIREEATRRGLAHLVHFTGPITEIEQAYRAADLFVMPSVREAFGMVLVEAMASGLPVIATRLEQVTDTVVDEGVSGLLVPPRDAEALSHAISSLLGDPVRAGRMAARARAIVTERYGLEVSAKRWLALYEETLAR